MCRDTPTSDTFTAFRHERFKEIKKEIGNFFDVYSEEASLDPANRIELKKILFKIELMFNYIDSTAYNDLKKRLYKYLKSEKPITKHKRLIKETHKLFIWIMYKAKLEAGITPEIEEKYRKMLSKQYSKCKDCSFTCNRFKKVLD